MPYLRIVTDAHGLLPLDGHLTRDIATTPTMVVGTEAMPAARRTALESRGVEVMICPATPNGYVDLASMLERLGGRGIVSILCEGGPTLAASLLAGAHVGRIYWLVAPEILGSASLAPAIATSTRTPSSITLRIDSTAMLGSDLLITSTPVHAATSPDDRST